MLMAVTLQRVGNSLTSQIVISYPPSGDSVVSSSPSSYSMATNSLHLSGAKEVSFLMIKNVGGVDVPVIRYPRNGPEPALVRV